MLRSLRPVIVSMFSIKKGKSGRDMLFLECEGEDFVSMINIMLDFIF